MLHILSHLTIILLISISFYKASDFDYDPLYENYHVRNYLENKENQFDKQPHIIRTVGLKMNFFESYNIDANYFDNYVLGRSNFVPQLIIVYSYMCLTCASYEYYLKNLFASFLDIGIQVHTVENNYNNMELIKRLNVGRVGPSFVGIVEERIMVFKYVNYETSYEDISVIDVLHDKASQLNMNDATSFFHKDIIEHLLFLRAHGPFYRDGDRRLSLVVRTLLALLKFIRQKLLIRSLVMKNSNNAHSSIGIYQEFQQVNVLGTSLTSQNLEQFFDLPSFLWDNKVRLLFLVPFYYTSNEQGKIELLPCCNVSFDDPHNLEKKSTMNQRHDLYLLKYSIYAMRHLVIAYALRSHLQMGVLNLYYSVTPKDSKSLNVNQKYQFFPLPLRRWFGEDDADIRISRLEKEFKSNEFEEGIFVFDSLSKVLNSLVCRDNKSLLYGNNITNENDPIISQQQSHPSIIAYPGYAKHVYLISGFLNRNLKVVPNKNLKVYIDYILGSIRDNLFPGISLINKETNQVRDVSEINVNLRRPYPKFPRVIDRKTYEDFAPLISFNYSGNDQNNNNNSITFASSFHLNTIFIFNPSQFEILINATKEHTSESPAFKFLMGIETFNDYLAWNKYLTNFSVSYMLSSKQTKFLDNLAEVAFDNEFVDDSLTVDRKKLFPAKISFDYFLNYKLLKMSSNPKLNSDAGSKADLDVVPILSFIRLPFNEIRYRFDVIQLDEAFLSPPTFDITEFFISPPKGYDDFLYLNSRFPDASSFIYFKNSLKSFWKNSESPKFQTWLLETTFNETLWPTSVSTTFKNHAIAWFLTRFGMFFQAILCPDTFNARLYRVPYPGGHPKEVKAAGLHAGMINNNPGLYKYFFKMKSEIYEGATAVDREIGLESIFPNTAIIGSEFINDEFLPHILSRTVAKVKTLFSHTARNLFGSGLQPSRDNSFAANLPPASSTRVKGLSVGRDDALTVLSVVFSFVFVLGGGYFMAYLVKLEEEKISEEGRRNPVKLPNRIINQDLIFHELKPGTYNALVRLLKPGCRTILIFLDENSKDMLLDRFSRILHPYRKNVSLMFGFVLISKYISWYRRLLLQVIGNNRKLIINPKNCVGTVLVINGYRKYYCIYHARHFDAAAYANQSEAAFNENEFEDDEDLDDEIVRSSSLSQHPVVEEKLISRPPYPHDEMDFVDNRNDSFVSAIHNGIFRFSGDITKGRIVKLRVDSPACNTKEFLTNFEINDPLSQPLLLASENNNIPLTSTTTTGKRVRTSAKIHNTPPPSYSSLYLDESLSINDAEEDTFVKTNTGEVCSLGFDNINSQPPVGLSVLGRKSSLPALKIEEVTPITDSASTLRENWTADLSNDLFPLLPNIPTSSKNPTLTLLPKKNQVRTTQPSATSCSIIISSMRRKGKYGADLSPNYTTTIGRTSEMSGQQPYDPQILDNLLRGLPQWLDKLFAGKVQRYYIDYWPPMKI